MFIPFNWCLPNYAHQQLFFHLRHNAQQDSGRDPLLSDLGLSQAAGHLAAGLLNAPFKKVSPGCFDR